VQDHLDIQLVYNAAVAKKISAQTARRLYTVLGVVGLIVFVAAVVLIALDPGQLGPYFTAVSGLATMASSGSVLLATRARAKD
jgi:hypothetical protein